MYCMHAQVAWPTSCYNAVSVEDTHNQCVYIFHYVQFGVDTLPTVTMGNVILQLASVVNAA